MHMYICGIWGIYIYIADITQIYSDIYICADMPNYMNVNISMCIYMGYE